MISVGQVSCGDPGIRACEAVARVHGSCEDPGFWVRAGLDISSIKTNYLSVLIHGCSAVLAQYLAFVEQMNGFPPFLCVQRKFLPKGSLYKA